MSIKDEMTALRQDLDNDIERNLQENMMLCKKEVIDYALRHSSVDRVAELGCVWGVDGVYGRYIAEKNQHINVDMVDTHWTEAANTLCGKYSNIRTFKENFGNHDLPGKVGTVDAVILFDVLLHQVAPDWDGLLRMWAPHTTLFLVANHQFTGTPISSRLLDLGEEEYLNNVPHDRTHPTYEVLFSKMYEIHPEHNRIWRDVHHVWQWGITNCDLLYVMDRIGFKPVYMKNLGACNGKLKKWDYCTFIFKKG